MIVFKNFDSLEKGTIFDALSKIYSTYPFKENDIKNEWCENWKEYDQLIFNNMETVGKAGFVTMNQEIMLGFCSWDPRNVPEYVIVGHNGILPAYRGNKYGSMQIFHMLELFKKHGFNKAYVTTGAEDFFIPAQKMYEACGFREIERFIQKNCEVIKYEKKI